MVTGYSWCCACDRIYPGRFYKTFCTQVLQSHRGCTVVLLIPGAVRVCLTVISWPSQRSNPPPYPRHSGFTSLFPNELWCDGHLVSADTNNVWIQLPFEANAGEADSSSWFVVCFCYKRDFCHHEVQSGSNKTFTTYSDNTNESFLL